MASGPTRSGATLQEGAVRLEQCLGAAVDAAEGDADPLGVRAERASVLEGQGGGDGGQAAAAIHPPGVLHAEALAGVLAVGHRERVQLAEALQLDPARARAAIRQGIPERGDAGADGAHHSRSRDHDPSPHRGHHRRRPTSPAAAPPIRYRAEPCRNPHEPAD